MLEASHLKQCLAAVQDIKFDVFIQVCMYTSVFVCAFDMGGVRLLLLCSSVDTEEVHESQ